VSLRHLFIGLMLELLHEPGCDLSHELDEHSPISCDLARSTSIRFNLVAVVEEVLVQTYGIVAINRRRDNFRLLLVAVAYPTITAVPVLAHSVAIFELDQHIYGKDEVTFAMNNHLGAIGGLALLLFRRTLLIPIQSVGRRRQDFVVEYRRAIDSLIKNHSRFCPETS